MALVPRDPPVRHGVSVIGAAERDHRADEDHRATHGCDAAHSNDDGDHISHVE
jgi:hypothetical protein